MSVVSKNFFFQIDLKYEDRQLPAATGHRRVIVQLGRKVAGDILPPACRSQPRQCRPSDANLAPPRPTPHHERPSVRRHSPRRGRGGGGRSRPAARSCSGGSKPVFGGTAAAAAASAVSAGGAAWSARRAGAGASGGGGGVGGGRTFFFGAAATARAASAVPAS